MRTILAATLVCAALTTVASGQQSYISRYDLFTGYSYFNSPKVKLVEHGFHLQFGYRVRTWMSLGVDYSRVTGDLTLTPNLLPFALQDTLSAQLRQLAAAGRLPQNYALSVVSDSTTQTFAAGPQFSYHGWAPITPFLRPSCGLIREVATPMPKDAIARGVVAQLASEEHVKDWTLFWGFGGGVDLNFSKHVSLRLQADLVRDHLFPDIIRESRGTVRFSIGPAFNFGKNIAGK